MKRGALTIIILILFIYCSAWASDSNRVIKITSPHPRLISTWHPGKDYWIKWMWNKPPDEPKVEIGIYAGFVSISRRVTRMVVSNSGSFKWHIPTNFQNGKYVIRIRGLNQNEKYTGTYGDSGVFRISSGSLTSSNKTGIKTQVSNKNSEPPKLPDLEIDKTKGWLDFWEDKEIRNYGNGVFYGEITIRNRGKKAARWIPVYLRIRLYDSHNRMFGEEIISSVIDYIGVNKSKLLPFVTKTHFHLGDRIVNAVLTIEINPHHSFRELRYKNNVHTIVQRGIKAPIHLLCYIEVVKNGGIWKRSKIKIHFHTPYGKVTDGRVSIDIEGKSTTYHNLPVITSSKEFVIVRKPWFHLVDYHCHIRAWVVSYNGKGFDPKICDEKVIKVK